MPIRRDIAVLTAGKKPKSLQAGFKKGSIEWAQYKQRITELRHKRKPLEIKRPPKELRRKIHEENEKFARARKERLAWLKILLRTKNIDPKIVRIAEKFARLPFAYIRDSCEGHFRRTSDSTRNLRLEALPENAFVHYFGAEFEIVHNSSREATEFRNELLKLEQKLPFVIIAPGKTFVNLMVEMEGTLLKKRISKQKALQIVKENQMFLGEFERIVDKFLQKK